MAAKTPDKPAEKPNHITLVPNARGSFLHIFKPRKAPGSEKMNYQASYLLHKVRDAATIATIRGILSAIAKEQFAGKIPAKVCLQEANLKDYDGYDDEHLVLSTSGGDRPSVVDQRKNPITEEDNLIYSGDYINGYVRFYGWTHPTGGKGISAETKAVQLVRQGERFGAAPVDAQEVFSEVPTSPEDI